MEELLPPIDAGRLEKAYQTALAALLAERHPDGYWVGELSTSSLSTATAISALALVLRLQTQDSRLQTLIDNGLRWLIEHQNHDGGWGDTDRSFSNISTTMLCRAALKIGVRGHGSGVIAGWPGLSLRSPGPAENAGASKTQRRPHDVEQGALSYLDQKCGPGPKGHAEAIRARYGKDRTFSVPILMNAALAGLVDWSEVPPLPFELACLPQSWFRFLRLPVVSYALPALIAIGQAIYHHRPPRNPITRLVRRLSRERSLRVLQRIQPSSGGFLEAIPLTSFVVMSLASIGRADHPVVKKGVEFLVNSVRPDGSWPIDSNLSVWVTTLSINALAAAGELENLHQRNELKQWLLKQQYRGTHPYTGAAAGGWAWTHLPGGVPDADDSPGALIAFNDLRLIIECASDDCPIHGTDRSKPRIHVANFNMPTAAALMGLEWLLGLQNRDGGWPTFCRGWGTLAFDRSGPDLTGHALRAIKRWRRGFGPFAYVVASDPEDDGLDWNGRLSDGDLDKATHQGFLYLARTQRPDGAWLPLWLGNQHAADEANPVYGTARVLAAYRDLSMMDTEPARRGVAYLLSVQNPDGGWGGDRGCPSSVEETALSVEILLDVLQVRGAVARGLIWLIGAVETGRLKTPEPIGFYFAKLWYYEKLYPIIFAVAALGRARRKTLESASVGE